MTSWRRRNLGGRFLIAACVAGAFLLGALAAAVSVAVAANGLLAVAVTAGAAAVGGVVAPLLIQALITRTSLRSAWDRPGGGIVRPLAIEDDGRALDETGGSPAEMLRAEREIVRFRGRATELGDLLRWCRVAEPSAVRLCWGVAGVGKTRLARQLAWELGDGWERGFLRMGRADQAMAVIKTLHRPVLLIIDQAEAHSGLDSLLAEAAAYTGPMPLRILLLARSTGEWWRRIVDRPGASAAERALLRQVAAQLRPDAIEVIDQQQVYERALRAYAARLDRPVPSTKLVTIDRRSAPVVLSLHSAALAAALGGRVTIALDSEIFTELLEHEDSYWQAAAAGVDAKLNLRQCRQVVAVGTLLGARQPSGAENLLARLPALRNAGAPLAQVADWLHELYPAPDGEWIGPLQPDVLADTLILAELSAEPRLLDVVRWALDEPAAQLRVLTFLARTAANDPQAQELLSILLGTELERLAVPAMDIARAVPGPLPAALAVALTHAEPNPNLDAVIEKHLIEAGLFDLLAELAETVTRRQVERARADVDLPALSRLLSNLGIRLDRLGRHEEALSATEEAVALYRQLVTQGRAADLPNLAGALNNLGNELYRLGRHEDALEATEEAIALYRQLVTQDRDAQLPGLAIALNNLGIRLDRLGRHEEALSATEESAALKRQLVMQRPDAHLTGLAATLNSLSIRLDRLGRNEEALSATEESVALTRRLVARRPDAHLPDLAMALNNFGIQLENLGRHEEALSATEESVALTRRLVTKHADAHLPTLAATLSNLANQLDKLGRYEDALTAIEESVAHNRQLAETRPDAHLPNLATTLSNLSKRLDNLGRHEDALTAKMECVGVWQAANERHPTLYRSNLAAAEAELRRLKPPGDPAVR